jgi:hypothetical protein
MALSIIAVIILWVTIGHIGPTYSSNVMSQQRRRLRQHYGLPAEPIITNLKILQIPPSLRSVPPSIYYGHQLQIGDVTAAPGELFSRFQKI